MSFSGQDVIDVGSSRRGQAYVLGARVPLDNANWKGPWDCAEFASWCAYQAYGLIFGAGKVSQVAKAEPYSGHWYDDARTRGQVIRWQDALKIPGAALIRAPAPGKIGHVAFALGDGERTLEARGKEFGVSVFDGAAQRAWSIGCLLPAVDYAVPATVLLSASAEAEAAPVGHLWLRRPNFRGPDVVALQRALAAAGVDPGPVDGAFGPNTQAALISFQVMRGLEVDGLFGPRTAAALDLSFPIRPSAVDEALFRELRKPALATGFVLAAADNFDAIVSVRKSGKTYTAVSASGHSFIIGSVTEFTDDMPRLGLFQGKTSIQDSLRFGSYAARDFAAELGQWAHLIEPTLLAESGARFATLNTYDRAAFTFGAPQLAAHTPEQNFVVYLRALLALPDAQRHFPELALRANASGKITVHRVDGNLAEDLEHVVEVIRPNGKRELQLARLMAFLNPSATAIDAAELSVAARLMNWLRLDPAAKRLQIEVFIDQMRSKLVHAKARVARFDGSDWRTALWIMDILHQGRGSFAELSAALASANPEAALKRLGWPKYRTRIETVERAVARLAADGVLEGFAV
ncbi:MAG: peptidoglycan-binding protein [Rhodanobacteraceae bacterium]|nr:peptidoglycan-binding protein [Rhodanobacteraceae bacterium]